MPNMCGILKWDHFFIPKKLILCQSISLAFISYANPTEKEQRTVFETKVGQKTISAASFNLHYNLSKILSSKTKVC